MNFGRVKKALLFFDIRHYSHEKIVEMCYSNSYRTINNSNRACLEIVILKKKLFLIWLIALLLLQGCGEKYTSAEPDVVSSISMNRDQYLTVVANCDEIEDKEEFAWKLIEMCRENSFHTIKFSTDSGYATGIRMIVYLWEDEIEGHDALMEIDYKPVNYNLDSSYDIVNNPDKFECKRLILG